MIFSNNAPVFGYEAQILAPVESMKLKLLPQGVDAKKLLSERLKKFMPYLKKNLLNGPLPKMIYYFRYIPPTRFYHAHFLDAAC